MKLTVQTSNPERYADLMNAGIAAELVEFRIIRNPVASRDYLAGFLYDDELGFAGRGGFYYVGLDFDGRGTNLYIVDQPDGERVVLVGSEDFAKYKAKQQGRKA